MTLNQNPTLTINVDLCNPGQFFACCGLLELAHRLSPLSQRAIGWFEAGSHKNSNFHIMAFTPEEKPITLQFLTESIKECLMVNRGGDGKEGPFYLNEPFQMWIDWRKAIPQNSMVKTWAGQQVLFKIAQSLQKAICTTVEEPYNKDLLNIFGPVKADDKKKDIAVTAFNIAKSENVIDAGFSADKLSDRIIMQPAIATEFLALIGLQRFCPTTGKQRLARSFYAWHTPLPAPIAAVAVFRPFSGIQHTAFTFQMYERDSEGRYKAFSIAKPIQGESNNDRENNNKPIRLFD